MVTDMFLGLVATLVGAVLDVLPAWSFVRPGLNAANQDTMMVEVLAVLGPLNGLAPVMEIFTIGALVAALVAALLIVKGILWVVERVFDVIP